MPTLQLFDPLLLGQWRYPVLLTLAALLLCGLLALVVPSLARCLSSRLLRTRQERRIREIREIGCQARQEMQRLYNDYLQQLAKQGRY